MKIHLLALAVLFSAIGSLAVAQTTSAKTSTEMKAAFESFPSCDRYARFDDENFYVGVPSANRGVQIIPIADPSKVRTLNTKTASLDAVRVGQTLWVLTYTELEEWDLTSDSRVASYPTYAYPHAPENDERPASMALYKDRLVIAHGRLGFSVFDTTKKIVIYQNLFVPEQAPKESTAKSVAVSGGRAYFTLEDSTLAEPGAKQAFRGIIVVNLETNAVESALDGMDPGSDAVVTDGQKLIVSFWGQPIWKYALSSLTGRKIPEPELRVWKFALDGHPTGQPSLDGKYYYTCYNRRSENGHYTRVPYAMDRSVLGL